MNSKAHGPSSGLSATFSRPSDGRSPITSAFSRVFSREKVPAGRMRENASFLNRLALLCVFGAAVMLGKSCWITVKAEVAQVLLDRAFTQSISSGENVKAWGWADTWPVAEVRVPRLSARAIVLHGSTTEALAFGPAYLPDTPKPGERGTSVIAAHRDTHFAFLKHLNVNDEIIVQRTDGLEFRYTVTNLRVAKWNTSGIDRHAPGHRLVLSTCWPFDSVARGDDRYIVEAVMVK
jgi:sortase A